MPNKLKIIMKCLESEKHTLQRAINDAKLARDNAPSATESHHDTERNQNENLVSALEHDLEKLNQAIANLPDTVFTKNDVVTLWNYVKIKNNSDIIKSILVPENIGGRETNGVKLIAVNTPIGKSLLNKRPGDKFKVNDNIFKILSLA